MGMASWRGRVAHLASPWQWGEAAFAVFVVGVLALSVAVLVRAATGPVSTSGKVVSVGAWAVGVYLIYVRPLVRTMRRRRTASR
jgi:hypothetical protein